ncbi:MAG TPA: hypothetical protein VMA53_14770 [Stellaceae bacterium]|nr:hypothetical protein [Stellaceae bacterium]
MEKHEFLAGLGVPPATIAVLKANEARRGPTAGGAGKAPPSAAAASASAGASAPAAPQAKGVLNGPMLPDCKPIKGKVPGPAEHLLCETHGHVLDVKAKKIIATTLDQYKSQGLGKPGAAHPAPAAPPTPPPSAAVPPLAAAAPRSADADAANAQAEIKKLLSQMQLEVEDIAFIRKQHEEVAGGGRLNRAVSWVSDKLGGADDPGDELAGISGKMMVEHIAGMGAVGSLKFDEARNHLAAMKELNQHAHELWAKYTGDTTKGAGRAVTGLEVASKAGDYATMGLNVVAPGAGKVLSITKNVAVTGSKLAFGQKVNWAEFSIDMAFDLFVGGEGGNINKAAEKLAGPLAKDLAPNLSKAIAKKWGAEAGKKLGAEVTENAIEKYIVTQVEEMLTSDAKDLVTSATEKIIETAKDQAKEMTGEELANAMLQTMSNPSGEFARRVSERVLATYKG